MTHGDGTFPSLTFHEGSLWLLFQAGAKLLLLKDGQPDSEIPLPDGSAAFPVISSQPSGLFAAWRHGLAARLINVMTAEVVDVGPRAEGNNPILLADDSIYWQANDVVKCAPLSLPSSPPFIARPEMRGTGITRTLNGQVRFWDEDRLAEPWMQNPRFAGDYLVGEGSNFALVRHKPSGREARRWIGLNSFQPVIAVDGDRIAVATWGSNLVRSEVLRDADLTDAEPQPDPVPVPSGDDMQALPRKLWMFSFHSHTEAYPPDVPMAEYAGNAISVVSREGNPAMMARDLARVSALAQPMIVDAKPAEFGGALNPNLTVLWWTAGADEAALAEHVRVAAGLSPAVPILAYLDRGEHTAWPVDRPGWLTDKTWPMTQAYPNPGETVDSFRTRASRLLERVTTYGNSVGLVAAFFDRNSAVPIAQIEACLPVYEHLIREFPVMAFGMFADRRPGGITQYPQLRPKAMAFLRALVARPNRYDGWNSPDVDNDLRNKMGQTIELVQFSQAEKDRVLSLLNGAPDPEPDPDPDPVPPGLMAPNRIDAVRKAIHDHPEIDPMNEAERGKIIDHACVITGDPRWGRKARNQDGTNKNTDGMCFKRPDGKHEIYDAISGGDGSATWEGFGPFNPGENGWWAPHEPV